jgi:hypothetical protein
MRGSKISRWRGPALVFLFVFSCLAVRATCFTPYEWQQPVTFGPLVGQSKLVSTPLDNNHNFIDDQLEPVAAQPGPADIVVLLNKCIPIATITSTGFVLSASAEGNVEVSILSLIR